MMKSIRDVVILSKDQILGEGAFSEVVKVRLKKDNKIYALKKINSKEISKEDIQNLEQEIQLHKSIQHPNIIQFFDNTQENNMVYLLLEYAGNGNLFFYIHSIDGLPEKLALRFLYQTALAVCYLHDRNIIHRDIKPENILLDENFNVKLCDLGWGCQHDEGYRKSICGTYEYMSPEIVLKHQHNNKVDIWCLGILLYEMLHGSPPFEAENLTDIKKQLKSFSIMIRDDLSPDTKALLQYMLKTNENQRYSIDQVLSHPSMTSNMNSFFEPISQNDYQTLMKNYLLNNGENTDRNLPDCLEDLLIKNPRLKMNVDEVQILDNLRGQLFTEPANKTKKAKKMISLNCQIPNKTTVVQEFDYNKYKETGFISFNKKKSEKVLLEHQIDKDFKIDYNSLIKTPQKIPSQISGQNSSYQTPLKQQLPSQDNSQQKNYQQQKNYVQTPIKVENYQNNTLIQTPQKKPDLNTDLNSLEKSPIKILPKKVSNQKTYNLSNFNVQKSVKNENQSQIKYQNNVPKVQWSNSNHSSNNLNKYSDVNTSKIIYSQNNKKQMPRLLSTPYLQNSYFSQQQNKYQTNQLNESKIQQKQESQTEQKQETKIEQKQESKTEQKILPKKQLNTSKIINVDSFKKGESILEYLINKNQKLKTQQNDPKNQTKEQQPYLFQSNSSSNNQPREIKSTRIISSYLQKNQHFQSQNQIPIKKIEYSSTPQYQLNKQVLQKFDKKKIAQFDEYSNNNIQQPIYSERVSQSRINLGIVEKKPINDGPKRTFSNVRRISLFK